MSYDPVKKREYYEKKKEEILNKKKEYYEKNKEREKEKKKEYYEKNKEIQKEKRKEYYEKNTEKQKESVTKYREDRKQRVVDFIQTCEILDKGKWDMWCNEIKRCAKKDKKPYSVYFTNDIIFDLMIQGCFYCGQLATTIDRLDSKLDHTPDNCVASCHGCNMSKGAADPSTFIRKAYYRTHERYYDDDTDIWFVHKNKPSMYGYKRRAEKKGVPFDLTMDYFNVLIKGDCVYCHRSPVTWFGIDREVPSFGYVSGNVVSCCFDCNVDKFEDDVDTMIMRNERIADRVDAGTIVVVECDKMILHKKHR